MPRVADAKAIARQWVLALRCDAQRQPVNGPRRIIQSRRLAVDRIVRDGSSAAGGSLSNGMRGAWRGSPIWLDEKANRGEMCLEGALDGTEDME